MPDETEAKLFAASTCWTSPRAIASMAEVVVELKFQGIPCPVK